MTNHYTVHVKATSLDAGDEGFAPTLVRQDFETKYEALKWAWLIVKHKNDILNLGLDLDSVEFICIASLDDDDDYYFDATADTDDLVFIAALAKENPQAPFASIDDESVV